MHGEENRSAQTENKENHPVLAMLQVCSREPARGRLLPLLRRLDVWRHHVGDVHLLRGALVRLVGQAGRRALASSLWECGSARRPLDPRPSAVFLPPPLQILWRVEREGERLEKPPDCPQELYAVMRKCWMCNPNDRPNFTQLGVLVAEVGV